LASLAGTAAAYAGALAIIWYVTTRWHSARSSERLESYAID
jgi:hypothetical protein